MWLVYMTSPSLPYYLKFNVDELGIFILNKMFPGEMSLYSVTEDYFCTLENTDISITF